MDKFAFAMGAEVTLAVSQETGTVVARAEFMESDNQYQVRYQRADGCATECWWSEKSLKGREVLPIGSNR